ncbi:MAG: transglutaminase-like domain-containing protein [Eubacterium sp.]|nr:transglutaminase-like domain-containing protein [Eubacterium sp.]
MVTKAGNTFKKILVLVFAVCVLAASLTQTAKAASSSEKLEEKTAQIVGANVKANDSAKKKLKKLFTYMQKENDYGRKVGFDAYSGWEKDYALEMYEDQKGSCYHYAAAYAFLAKKATGYSVRIGVGQTDGFSGKLQKHAWTEVKIGGKWYIVDPNMDKYAADSSGKYFLKKRNSLKNSYNKFQDTAYYQAAF